MKKIMYVVSTLKSSGPTNQLFNIVTNLPKNVDVLVVTLSPEERGSQLPRFLKASIRIKSLSLGRFEGVFRGKSKLREVIDAFAPDIIHSQGIRADKLMSTLDCSEMWVMTSRNYPFDDYPMKFGRFKGKLMAFTHMRAMKKCRHVVACSKAISEQLAHNFVVSKVIQNGVALPEEQSLVKKSVRNSEGAVFVTVGSLINRKNTSFIIKAFNEFRKNNLAKLYILGDGPLLGELKSIAGQDVVFTGNVNNVTDYLINSDYFISASYSEGLPNTVLEALACGLPCILSNIPSHAEIALESSSCIKLFDLEKGAVSLLHILTGLENYFSSDAKQMASDLALNTFSSKTMSAKYYNLYSEISG